MKCNRNVVKPDSNTSTHHDVYIGRSEVAMWMRVVSSWVCMLLYMWSLLAPVIMPDRSVLFLFQCVQSVRQVELTHYARFGDLLA